MLQKLIFYIILLIILINLLHNLIGLMEQYWYYVLAAILVGFILKRLLGK